MSFVLILVGILATVTGAVLAGFGIPINEFSLGNTLIIAGASVGTGGLVVIALGVAVGQLKRIAEALNAPRSARNTSDPFDSAGAAPGRSPAQPAPARNRADLSDAAAPRPAAFPRVGEPQDDSAVVAPPRAASRTPAPDSVEAKGWRPPRPSAKPELSASRGSMGNGAAGHQADADPAHDSSPESVTVLKSGVVDGMAYTLFTDGSIEAELAQGVIRFGSIEELRNHLEKSA